jgi:ATP-dependent Clp protease ATP-binding subunit ClpA
VFGDENAIGRFDMSEYSQEHASERLTGAPPGFVGHEQGGALTNWVIERPFSVVLFDEIEKANAKIFDKFLQIIDDGRLTDGQGRTAFFSHSIVIFTSNLGAATMPPVVGGVAPSYEQLSAHFTEAVDDFFRNQLGRPELRGRLGGGVVVFDMLREPTIRAITIKFLRQLTQSTRAKGYELVVDEESVVGAVAEHLMATGAALGARPIRDPLLERWMRVPLNRFVAVHNPPTGSRLVVHRTWGDPPFEVTTG